MLTEEAAFERQERTLNEIAGLIKDLDNRFTFERPDIAKRYLKGRLKVSLKFRPGRGGQKVICIFRCAVPVIVEDDDGADGFAINRKPCLGIQSHRSVHVDRAITFPGGLQLICGEALLHNEMLALQRPDD